MPEPKLLEILLGAAQRGDWSRAEIAFLELSDSAPNDADGRFLIQRLGVEVRSRDAGRVSALMGRLLGGPVG